MYERMPIFRAFGLGVAIVIHKLAMPEVVSGFETTLVQFFSVASHILDAADAAIGG